MSIYFYRITALIIFFVFSSFPLISLEKETINVGIFSNPPLVIVENGQFSGILIDIVDYIAEKESWKVNYHHYSYQTNVDLLSLGKIDMVPGLSYISSINKNYNLTETSVITSSNTIIAESGSRISSLKDLNNKRLGILSGYSYYRNLKDVLDDSGIIFTSVYYDSKRSLLDAVRNKRIDAAILSRIKSESYNINKFFKNIQIIIEPEEIKIGSSMISGIEIPLEKQLSKLVNINKPLYNSILLKYILPENENFIYTGNTKFLNYLFIFIPLILVIKLLVFTHLPIFKSISRIGRDITSLFDEEDLFSSVNSKINKLFKPDYFCIGLYDKQIMETAVFSQNKKTPVKYLPEKIDDRSSIFIYSAVNQKQFYSGRLKKEFSKYIGDNRSVTSIDSSVNSVLIIPLMFKNEFLGIIALLGKKKNAFSKQKIVLINSLSEFITIAVRNTKLYKNNRELLLRIEKDKNKILKAKQEVEYIAQHDPLTNLPNRLYLNEFLNQAIKKSNRTGKKLSVIFIDMDNFKEINDTYGHQAGDKVLILAAKRFKNLLRESDIVIRFGGDEFIIILEDINSAEDIKNVTNKIISTCSTPVLTENADLSLSFSMGISVYPDNGNSAEELIRKADIALYSVKNSTKGYWKFYSEQ